MYQNNLIMGLGLVVAVAFTGFLYAQQLLSWPMAILWCGVIALMLSGFVLRPRALARARRRNSLRESIVTCSLCHSKLPAFSCNLSTQPTLRPSPMAEPFLRSRKQRVRRTLSPITGQAFSMPSRLPHRLCILRRIQLIQNPRVHLLPMHGHVSSSLQHRMLNHQNLEIRQNCLKFG
jgi:hypothetical protein